MSSDDGSGAFGHEAKADSLDGYPDIYGIRALNSCRARQSHLRLARNESIEVSSIFHGKLLGVPGASPPSRRRLPLLVRANQREGLVDEDVVRPVDADVVDFVLAVAQLDDTIDDAAGVGGEGSLRRVGGCRAADDRP